MIAFLPDTDERFRELEKSIPPKHAYISGYDPHNVVELLSQLWAYPHTEYDAHRLLEGRKAEILYCRDTDVPKGVLLEDMGQSANRMKYLHGCDIVCYSHTDMKHRRFLLGMLQRDRCFVSCDPLSLADMTACMTKEDYEGVFVVYQLHVRAFPEWHEDIWKSFGCQARPHIQFSFP